ncbi:MAG: MFS transporter [Alicyclobacillus sp.]|nr:MFS transporter [Alicyclobacillus sp.]
MSVGVWGLAAWFPSYLSSGKHLNMTMTKNFLLLAYFVGLVVNLVLGRWIDRTQKRGLLGFLGFLFNAALLLIVGFVPAAPGVLLLIILIGVHYGISQPAGQGFIDRISVPARVGKESGVMNCIGNVVASIGPTLMGWLIGVAHGGYQYAFLFLVVVFLVSSLASGLLMRQGY